MAKSVTLSTGRTFLSVTVAKGHFAAILDHRKLNEPYSGDDLADIRALYTAYCIKTDWELRSPPASFYPTYDRGPAYTTRCFGVTFEDGTIARFSIDKALRAIAQ